MREKLVDFETAKRLKEIGFWRPCEYFYQDKDLKRTENGEELNHNKLDDFIYSAPTISVGMDYLIGVTIKYPSSLIIKLGGTPKC